MQHALFISEASWHLALRNTMWNQFFLLFIWFSVSSFLSQEQFPWKGLRALFALTGSFPPEFLILFSWHAESKLLWCIEIKHWSIQCTFEDISGGFQCFHQSSLASSWKLGLVVQVLVCVCVCACMWVCKVLEIFCTSS